MLFGNQACEYVYLFIDSRIRCLSSKEKGERNRQNEVVRSTLETFVPLSLLFQRLEKIYNVAKRR